MHRFIPILLLLGILQSIGISTFIFLQQIEAKIEMQYTLYKGYDEAKLVQIQVGDVSNLKWITSKEFIFEGKWMDIVRQEKKGKLTLFYCLEDQKEQNYHQKLSNNSLNLSSHTNHFSLLFTPLYWEKIDYISLSPFFPLFQEWHFYTHLPIFEGNTDSPPPDGRAGFSPSKT